ncbi:nuclear transport factor 2 family protein [Aureisphaera sp. CAU 1614]|uniref:Nuclear transport factor 2 family protein n=1 Tax=Halomarinibacterium sedimenti TaxID=2857106 RepID=A0A9X1JX27_9FLAO|nr:nuclear transport factor 2 family protein [Halomarinibacterium sedimenti]MBW2937668.1 nuclear transport factor 2 family protein [Halomarinibacterium sedimenti]
MKKSKSLSIYLLVLCTVCLSVWSCKEKEEVTPEVVEKARLYDISPNEEANIALVGNFIDALITNKSDALRSMVTAEYMMRGPSAKDSVNIDQLVSYWAVNDSLRSNQDAGIIIMTSLVANEGDLKGDWVHVWGTYTANLKGSDFSYNIPWHQVYQIDNGKITRTRTWYDRLDSALDMGTVVPAPAKKKKK